MKLRVFNPLAVVKVFTASLLMGACSVGFANKAELNLYIWSEYIDPEIITQFEEAFDCKVVVSLYESNEEMVAKLQAGGVSQYDIIVPSDFIMKSIIGLNLLQPIDPEKVPNLVNLSETFLNPPYDPGNRYTAAYQWGNGRDCI
jgi:spermidine/putrescine transport system substrate-binding protein